MNTMNIKWTKDICYQEAKKFKTKFEFRNNSKRAYFAAWKYNWLKDYVWFEKKSYNIDYSKKEYFVYSYEINEVNAVYVGLTKEIKRRDKHHRFGIKRSNGDIRYSSLYKFCENHKVPIPTPKILSSNITCVEAQEKEHDWLEIYINEKWNIINIAKTGVGVGSLGAISRWTEELCNQEAKKYDCVSKFKKLSSGAYRAAYINKWLENYDWFIRKNNQTHKNGYWNYETCYNEAKKYINKTEFANGCETAFKVASKNKWLIDYDWFINPKSPRNFWGYETCKDEAKKYKTRTEFCKKANQAYKKSLKNKWISEFYECKNK